MYPTDYNYGKTCKVLPMSSRKSLIDSLCTRAYNAHVSGESFVCANYSNAEFIASYLSFVFQSTFIAKMLGNEWYIYEKLV